MIEYLQANALRLAFLTQQHIELVLLAVAISTVIAVTLAVLTERYPRVQEILLSITATVLTMPSFALFALTIPLFGLGVWPSIVVLSLYGVFPIFRNTVTGFRGVDAAVLDAARGLGMSNTRRLWRVKIPLAMPVIVNGIRLAAIMLVATAAIAAAVRGPGLGDLIFRGLARIGGANALEEVLAGIIGIVLVAIVLDLFFLLVRTITTPRGIHG
ncbi:MAG: ABC transporter permease [Mobilicoccus sp.]|nr:ABC transporter permease [Mobilicoccus sp.]